MNENKLTKQKMQQYRQITTITMVNVYFFLFQTLLKGFFQSWDKFFKGIKLLFIPTYSWLGCSQFLNHV